MATVETTERERTRTPSSVGGRTSDETKLSLKTTEFWAMAGLIAAVAIGYMISRGLAKSGTKYAGGEDPLNRNNH